MHVEKNKITYCVEWGRRRRPATNPAMKLQARISKEHNDVRWHLFNALSFPLQYAACNGYYISVRYLCEHDIDINHDIVNEAFKSAATNGYVRVVKYLHLKGAIFDDASLLHWVVRFGQFNVFVYIVEHMMDKQDMNEHDVYCYLATALTHNYYNIAKYVFKNVMHSGHDILFWAIDYNDLCVVKYLNENGYDIHANKYEALRLASRSGKFSIVKYLCENGSNIHVDNDYPIRQSAKYGYYKQMIYLHKLGGDIHAENDYALRWATRYGKHRVLKYIQNLEK